MYCSQLGWKKDLEACNKAIPKFLSEGKSGRQDQIRFAALFGHCKYMKSIFVCDTSPTVFWRI